MKIIRLNTVKSTNTYLKNIDLTNEGDNYTVVVAKEQTAGRGQMKSKWISEAGKNLTFSVLCRFNDLKVENQKYLNYAISLGVYDVLKELKLSKLSIKWPNDILSGKKKVCGILIENNLKGSYIKSSVIGVGLNVNQEKFNNDLVMASSLKNILKKDFDLESLLQSILERIKQNIDLLNSEKFDFLNEKYLKVLYKKGIPNMFKNKKGVLFMGKIIGVSKEGKLQVELTDETIKEFGIKEISIIP